LGERAETVGERGPLTTPARTRRVPRPTAALAVAVVGSSMAFVDASSVNIAVPNIAAHFSGSHLSNVSWVLNAYSIVFASFLVGGGQLADLLGRRRAFSFSLIAFTFCSGLCALAPSLNTLIAARVLEAAAGALLVPSSLAIVLDAHDADDRVHAVALWSAIGALAAGVGPLLGASLITASSWRLVFLINVPLGLVAFALARRVLVESRAPGRRRLPDLLGALVLTGAIAALVLGVVKGEGWGWANARVLLAFCASALLGAYFCLRASRQRSPVIDPALLRVRDFVLSNGATTVIATGFFAYTLCNVLFLTSVWHYSILSAGLALTPEPVVAIALAVPTIRLVRRLDHRPVLAVGALVWAGGMAYLAFALDRQPDFLGGWLPGMVLLGLGAGLTFPTLSGVAIGAVPGARFAVASSLNSVATQLGAALGVGILIAIAGSETFDRLRDGWLLAGGCFVLGAVPCLALKGARDAPGGRRDEEPELGRVNGQARVGAGADTPRPEHARELPSLLESDGERALVAPQSVAEFLSNVGVFADLPAAMVAQIGELASDVTVARGEWLFREGDPADAIYVVRVGHLEVLSERPREQTLRTLTRGAVLGELALLSHTTRSASIRALRDTVVLKVDQRHFDELLRSQPALALSLTRVLSGQLQSSQALPVARRARPVTIALCTVAGEAPLLTIADELSAALCALGSVAVVHADDAREGGAAASAADAAARFGPVIERCERDHDHVVMVCDEAPGERGWEDFCLSRADRVLAVVTDGVDDDDERQPAVTPRRIERLRGCDLVGYGVEQGSSALGGWIARLAPAATYAIGSGDDRRAAVDRAARRLAGRSVGVVLAGAGARAFAHLGALDVLLAAGATVDRVGGVSMGAFIGAMLAAGHDSDAIDACCYEEWVRRNPVNDYTIPRASLTKGMKMSAMLERVFGDVCIEELSRSLYCASVDLRSSSLTIERHGRLASAVAASVALPLIAPPVRRGERLLIDGSLLDNLPVAPMAATGEGPVLAIDIKRGEDEAEPAGGALQNGRTARSQARLPPLTETISRVALLSSANTDEAARQHADMTIAVPVVGVGILEFHQIDQARAAGRRAAERALEDAPGWLLGETRPGDVAGRRTVLRM
jgi:NTE family protein